MIRNVINPITILLAVMSLQWVILAEFGAFTLLVPYLALALVAVCAPLSPQRLRAGAAYVRKNAIWLAALAIYLIIVWPILLDTPAANTSPRQLFYLLCSVGLAAYVATARNLQTLFRVGAALGLVIFAVFTELLARGIGLSWADAIAQFVFSGNLKFVFYSFFTAIFNSLSPDADAMISASRKNDVAGCILVLLLLFRSGAKNPERDLAGMAYTAGALVLLVMLNDRSILIAVVGSLLIATAMGARIRSVGNIPLLFGKIAAVLALMVLAVGMLPNEAGFWTALRDRFSFTDYSTEARLNQYGTALMRIEEHPFLGSGYSEANGHAIHNVFLAAWMYAGLSALFLIVVFYVAVVLRWLSFLLNLATKRGWWVLPLAPEWLAPLLLTPVFRVWISGEGGVLKFAEWVALSIFCGCMLANESLRRRLAQMRAAGPEPDYQDWRGSTDARDPDADRRLAGARAGSAAGRHSRPARPPGRPQRRNRI